MPESNGCPLPPHAQTPHPRGGEASNFGYYHEYCRLYLANVVLTSQMRELMNERAELIIRTAKAEVDSE